MRPCPGLMVRGGGACRAAGCETTRLQRRSQYEDVERMRGPGGGAPPGGQPPPLDQDAADKIVEKSLAAGVNFIDTADVYSFG
ncbi:hypothetical protein LAV81_13795, partial [Rhizobium sp. VS19-DR183]|nr:hypothetical protein [Rhizobium sp. VS19-DR183]